MKIFITALFLTYTIGITINYIKLKKKFLDLILEVDTLLTGLRKTIPEIKEYIENSINDD